MSGGYSLYVGIPFCPTTCLYCSFTSYPIGKWKGRTGLYLEALFKELEYTARKMEEGLWTRSISAEALPHPFQRRI